MKVHIDEDSLDDLINADTVDKLEQLVAMLREDNNQLKKMQVWHDMRRKIEGVWNGEASMQDVQIAIADLVDEAVLGKAADDEGIRQPTESELREARLNNIPTRGFCVSADEEEATAESYRHLYDPGEFEPPDAPPHPVRLIRGWMDDESGYDEEVLLVVKQLLDRHGNRVTVRLRNGFFSNQI